MHPRLSNSLPGLKQIRISLKRNKETADLPGVHHVDSIYMQVDTSIGLCAYRRLVYSQIH